MEQHNLYKQLLQQGSEKASPEFTKDVMVAINLTAKPFVYQSLVPPAVKRIFIVGFISVVSLIFILCLLIAAAGFDFTPFTRLPNISPETFKQTLTIIILFCAIYGANYWITERKNLVADRQ